MLGSKNRNPVEEMRRREIMTASPAQLTVKLFQRLMLDLRRAQAEPSAAASHLVHAQRILAELDATLDPSKWSGAADLKAVYAYCLESLAAANRNSDIAGVTTVTELLEPVAKAFEEAARTGQNAIPGVVVD